MDAYTKDSATRDGKRRSCRQCEATAARTRKARWKDGGRCTQCRQLHTNTGACCEPCLMRAKQRYADRHPEECASCRRGGLVNATQCEECWLKSVSRRFLGSTTKGVELKDMMVRQNFRCAVSGVPIRFGLNASLDHITPKSLGGVSDITNYRWVHTRVNQVRGNLSDAELYDLCSRIVATLAGQTLSEPTWLEAFRNGIY